MKIILCYFSDVGFFILLKIIVALIIKPSQFFDF